MAAPALVALAHGSRDPRSAETITALVDEVSTMRPDLRIEPAFLELVQARRSRRSSTGWSRPATTRSSSCRCCSPRPTTPRSTCPRPSPRRPPATRACRSAPPRVLGLEPCFLEVLDLRLREALKDARVRELDALVLAAAGSTDPLANQAVARLARLWGTHHKLPVTAAFASSAPPATGEAVRAFRAEGRRHIAVASLFLAPGLPARPGRRAGPRGRCGRGVRAARRPPRARPHHPGALRRRRRRAGPGLTAKSAQVPRSTAESALRRDFAPTRAISRATLRRLAPSQPTRVAAGARAGGRGRR